MGNSIDEEKLATESGYFPIFRYNPTNKKFFMDSHADFSKYYEFISGEDRYRTLKQLNKDEYNTLLEENKNNAERRFEYYKNLEESDEE